jgi:hypothetical protein
MGTPNISKKLVRKSILAALAPIAVLAPLSASYAQPQYSSQVDTFCKNAGTPRTTPTSCADCHSGTGSPSAGNANTALAAQWKAGNLAAFCPAGTTPSATPAPTARPSATPGVTPTTRPTTTPTTRPSTSPSVTPRPTRTPTTGSDDDHKSRSGKRRTSRSDD